MSNKLITRTILRKAAGLEVEQVAVIDTCIKPADSERGLFVDHNGDEYIALADGKNPGKIVGKVVLVGRGE